LAHDARALQAMGHRNKYGSLRDGLMDPISLGFAAIALSVLLARWVIFDLIRTLRTGRANTRPSAAKRAHQPVRFWTAVCAEMFVLMFCVAMICVAVSSPFSFAP